MERMAQVPSPETKSPELPSIIIDPMLYEPELHSTLLASTPAVTSTPAVSGSFARLTRVTIAVAAVGAATYGISQMRDVDSILPRAQVSALTSLFTGGSSVQADEPTAQVAALEPEPAPVAQEAPAVAPVPDQDPLAAAAALPMIEPKPLEQAEPSAPEPAIEAPIARAPAAVKPVAPKLAAAATTASDTAPPLAATTKPADKTAAIEDDVRNARRLLALNRLDQAEAAYRKVLSQKGGEPSALTGLARVQLARGQLDDALTSAMRAVAEAPQTAGTHLTLGDVLRARGDKSGAQAHYDQASALKAPAEP